MSKVKIGGIYKVKPNCADNCRNFESVYRKYGEKTSVKITDIRSSGKLDYDILDEDGNKRDSCNCFEEKHLIINDSDEKQTVPHFIVIWEERHDPAKFFATRAEAQKFINETLLLNDNVQKDSIKLVEIKTLWTVSVSHSLQEVKDKQAPAKKTTKK